MIDTNVKALALFTKIFSKLMVQRNKGHIINIGSIAGVDPYPGINTSLQIFITLILLFFFYICLMFNIYSIASKLLITK